MAQKIINVGTVANDGSGDTIRGAFTNVNANFTEVYDNISILNPLVFTISLIFLVSFITTYTLNLMSYFTDLIVGVTRVSTMINIGFLLASRDIILQLINESKINTVE